MFGNCLGLLDFLEILVQVFWALVCYVLQDHTFIFTLSDESLTVIIGLNSRAIIVTANRVWVCPWPCLESSTGNFVQVLVLENWLFFKYFAVYFEYVVEFFALAFWKFVYAAKVGRPESLNMPIDGLFKSV